MQDATEFKQVLCPYCKEQIRADAIKCKHCGSFFDKPTTQPNSLWVSIVSLVCSILALLASLDSSWDKDSIVGFVSSLIISITCAFITLSQNLNGKNIAITAIVFSCLAGIFALSDFL
jgi:hypothetical protein